MWEYLVTDIILIAAFSNMKFDMIEQARGLLKLLYRLKAYKRKVLSDLLSPNENLCPERGGEVYKRRFFVITKRQLKSPNSARGDLAQPFSRFVSIQCVTPAPIFASLRFTVRIGASLISNTLYAKSLIQLNFQGAKVASELVDVGRKI